MSCLVDTNILTGITDRHGARHSVCKRALETFRRRGEALYIGAQNASEFWAVATRPEAANGLGLLPAQAEAELWDLEKTVTWLEEPPELGVRWRELVNRYEVRGKQAHDARLVAFMLCHGLDQILTLNTDDFARYTEITALHPSAV